MIRKLDIATWPRKDHFHFFRQFEEPFFGVCTAVDCTQAYRKAKEMDASFFLYYLYQSLRAANGLEPFAYRIQSEEVIVYDEVHASPTINRPDGTFGFAYFDFHPSFTAFQKEARAATEKVQKEKGLVPAVASENVIHYSTLPWIHFTSLAHARAFSFKDSIPKISFGKISEGGKKKRMPVSVHVHHALMDGYHIGQYFDLFQTLLNEK
jgi:chloramphenicol O-acetyltransferase type A